MDRSMEAGTPTLFRPIPNEYGTLDDPQEIEFALLRCDGGIFTYDEQIKIETWLTAPRLSTPLYFVRNGNKSITGPTPYYYGVFTKTEWIPGGKGFIAVKLTFKPTTVYPFMKTTQRISLKGDKSKKISISKVNLDEYLYPVIVIKNNSGDFSVQNTSVGDQAMELTGISAYDNVVIDCKNCIITGDERALSFTEVGWLTPADIVWLRLCQGKNELELEGNGEVTITYEVPYKKVGGWFE